MNWKAEATDKLRRYDAMRLATVNIPQELKRLALDAHQIKTGRFDNTPVTGGESRREEALLNNMIHRQELENTLNQAKLWLQTVDRAISVLSPEEKLILNRLFIYPKPRALDALSRELGQDLSTIYRKRDRALHQFTLAFYGNCEI